jgi:hypothetical protein
MIASCAGRWGFKEHAETHTQEIILVARKVLVKGYEKRIETERESH